MALVDDVRDVVAAVTRQRVRDDEPLVSSGLIDSLSVLNLITALEERLRIRIPAGRVQPEDFDSVERIMETLARVRAL